MSGTTGRDRFGAELALLGFVPELLFHPRRKWRLDWACPAVMVAVEYQGFVGANRGHGDVGHASIAGMLRDQEKWTEAQLHGWLVVLVNARSVGDGTAMAAVYRALATRGVEVDRWLAGERTA